MSPKMIDNALALGLVLAAAGPAFAAAQRSAFTMGIPVQWTAVAPLPSAIVTRQIAVAEAAASAPLQPSELAKLVSSFEGRDGGDKRVRVAFHAESIKSAQAALR